MKQVMASTLLLVVLTVFAAEANAQKQSSKPAPQGGPSAAWSGDCPGMGGTMGGPMMGGPMMGGMGGPMMGGTGGPMMGSGRHYGYGMLGRLNLSDSQRKEVGKLLDEQQKRQYELMGKGMDLHSRLRDLYGQEKWDADAIVGVYDQMAKLRSQMVRSRIENRNRIYDLLTPEQRSQFRQWGDPLPE